MKVYTSRAKVGDLIRLGKKTYVVVEAEMGSGSLGWHVRARRVKYSSHGNYTYEPDAAKVEFYQGGGGAHHSSRPHVPVIGRIKMSVSTNRSEEIQEAT